MARSESEPAFDDQDDDRVMSVVDANPISSQNLTFESLEEDDVRSPCLARVSRLSQANVDTATHALQQETNLATDRSSTYTGKPLHKTVGEFEDDEVDWEAVATLAQIAADKDPNVDISQQHTNDPELSSDVEDIRSPLERFRTRPKKPLSVTDIVSPAWCELQYWYTLTKFGKKKRTPAMKQGSAIHRTLEEQVHTVVPIAVSTKEDAWGLRIWNVIQGIRTLRTTGLTRELEVWGVIDGEVVIGVIDEVSVTCPDDDMEAGVSETGSSGQKGIPADQQTIDEYFSSQEHTVPRPHSRAPPRTKHKVYLTDVKTRSRHSLPSQPAMRPTLMQLMLYRFLLASLAANEVPAQAIFERFDLDASSTFTDDFISNVSSLDVEHTRTSDPPGSVLTPSSQNAVQELQQHNNLTLLWQLMIQEFASTIPSPDSIGHVLRAQFIHATDGVVIGNQCFVFDAAKLEQYVKDELRWWKGERPAKGVEIEEAYKCRICEFAESCSWRKHKIEEAIGKHRDGRRRLQAVVAGK